MAMLPRMRTADGVLAEIKALDPDTGVTMSYIRRLVKSGQIPVVSVGRKKLVDLDKVLAFLAKGEQPKPEVATGQIRRVT